MDTPDPKPGIGVLGAGAAACAACCAGPIVGFLTATGIALLLGAVVVGIVGLLAVLAVAAVLYRRRAAGVGPARPLQARCRSTPPWSRPADDIVRSPVPTGHRHPGARHPPNDDQGRRPGAGELVTDPKTLVRRLVDDVINANTPDALDDIATPALARTLHRAFDQFRAAFPDWYQEIVQLVAEGDTIVARFRCTGTHLGPWQDLQPTGRTMNIDEVYFFRVTNDRLARVWGLEDTWTRRRQLRGDPTDPGEHGSLD